MLTNKVMVSLFGGGGSTLTPAEKLIKNGVGSTVKPVTDSANSSVFTTEDIAKIISSAKQEKQNLPEIVTQEKETTNDVVNNTVKDTASAILEGSKKQEVAPVQPTEETDTDSARGVVNSYTPVQSFQVSDEYKRAMEYTSQLLAKLNSGITSRTEEINALLNDYKNRKEFAYDPNEDLLFQQMLGQAMASGQVAMQDTIGQAAALTGGYGNTYATTAGNNAYNQYVQGAYENLPAYYQLALDNYNQEGENLLNQIALLNQEDAKEYERMLTAYETNYNAANQLYNQEYAAWRDSVSDSQYAQSQENWEREYLDGLSQYEEQFNYQKEQDTLAQENWQKEFDAATASSADTTGNFELSSSLISQLETAYRNAGGGQDGENAMLDVLEAAGMMPDTETEIAVLDNLVNGFNQNKTFNYNGQEYTYTEAMDMVETLYQQGLITEDTKKYYEELFNEKFK